MPYFNLISNPISRYLNIPSDAPQHAAVFFNCLLIDAFQIQLLTRRHFYPVFYSKFANNILVYTAGNGFLCMLELGLVGETEAILTQWKAVHK